VPHGTLALPAPLERPHQQALVAAVRALPEPMPTTASAVIAVPRVSTPRPALPHVPLPLLATTPLPSPVSTPVAPSASTRMPALAPARGAPPGATTRRPPRRHVPRAVPASTSRTQMDPTTVVRTAIHVMQASTQVEV
jgi:hypothetical protein